MHFTRRAKGIQIIYIILNPILPFMEQKYELFWQFGIHMLGTHVYCSSLNVFLQWHKNKKKKDKHPYCTQVLSNLRFTTSPNPIVEDGNKRI